LSNSKENDTVLFCFSKNRIVSNKIRLAQRRNDEKSGAIMENRIKSNRNGDGKTKIRSKTGVSTHFQSPAPVFLFSRNIPRRLSYKVSQGSRQPVFFDFSQKICYNIYRK